METTNEFAGAANYRKRHGCLTAWLILMIVGSTLAGIGYIVGQNSAQLKALLPPEVDGTTMVVLALISLLNIVFAIMLWRWRKLGFYGLAVTTALAFGLNLYLGVGIGTAIAGTLGLVILFGLLQLKEGGRSAWDQLS